MLLLNIIVCMYSKSKMHSELKTLEQLYNLNYFKTKIKYYTASNTTEAFIEKNINISKKNTFSL